MCKIVLLKVITLLLMFSLILSSCMFSIPVIYTDNIKDYSKHFSHAIFPEDIPTNAEVVKFTYYSYWNEDYDCYLELSFSNESDMFAYLSKIYDNAMKDASPVFLCNDSCFFEVRNPYNESYTDLLYLGCMVTTLDNTIDTEKIEYTGFKVNADESPFCLIAMSVISYSQHELRVIHSATVGSIYSETQNEYIPQYLARFDISIKENSKRHYYFKHQDAELIYIGCVIE